MKNVFGICQDKTKKDNNQKMDGDLFISATVDSSQQDALESLDLAEEHLEKKASLPKSLTIVKCVALALGACCVVGILRGTNEVTLSQAFQNAPWVFVLAGICLALGAVLVIVEKQMAGKLVESDDFKSHVEKAKSLANLSMEILNIPSNAASVDVLAPFYKLKKDKEVPVLPFQYLALDMYVYADDKELHIADSYKVYSFSRSDILKLEKIEKKVTMGGWNKEEAFNSPKYKPYKLTENDMGTIFMKCCYSLQLNSDFGAFEILFPPYEIDYVAGLLDLTVPTEDAKKDKSNR